MYGKLSKEYLKNEQRFENINFELNTKKDIVFEKMSALNRTKGTPVPVTVSIGGKNFIKKRRTKRRTRRRTRRKTRRNTRRKNTRRNKKSSKRRIKKSRNNKKN